jgi:hypothetical protein
MNYRDDTRIKYKDGDIERIGTLCKHNFPVEDEILNNLKFKVGDKITSTKSERVVFLISSISYDLFKGRNRNYIRYEFDNYQFIWVQNEDDYFKV